jgi:hypothetical protein
MRGLIPQATPPYFKRLQVLAGRATEPDLPSVAENGGLHAGGWGDYADAVAGKNGAVLSAGCVAGVEGEGKDVETRMHTEVATSDSSTGGANTDEHG